MKKGVPVEIAHNLCGPRVNQVFADPANAVEVAFTKNLVGILAIRK